MPDQYQLGAYGDSFLVKTPAIDAMAKQLYAQQRERQLRQQQENQQLDQMIQKDYGRIRSVDTPEVVDGYGKVKSIRKELLFDKNLQKDPLAYNKKQQELNKAVVDLRGTINGSAEIKEANKNINAAQLKDPDAFSDQYGNMMATQMNTPLSQLKAHPVYGDLTNADNYRYKGSNTNFNEIVTKVYDKKNKIVGKEEPLDKEGIQFRSPVYEYGTGPAQVYEGLTNSLDHKTERDAAYKWKQLTPDVIQKIEQDYKAIPKSKWEQMGLPGPQEIPLRGGSDAEKYMRVLAMQNAVNTNPRLVNYENRTSDLAKANYKFAQDKVMEGIKFGHQKQLKKEDQNIVDNWIGNYWNTRINEAKSGQPTALEDLQSPIGIKGAHQIQLDNVAAKALARNGVEPERLYVTQDNKILPVFYEYKETFDENGKKTGTSVVKDAKGNPVIDKDMSVPVGLDQAYLAMGYRGQTKKALGGTMEGVYQGKAGVVDHPLPSGKPLTVKQGGYTYTWNSQTGKYE